MLEACELSIDLLYSTNFHCTSALCPDCPCMARLSPGTLCILDTLLGRDNNKHVHACLCVFYLPANDVSGPSCRKLSLIDLLPVPELQRLGSLLLFICTEKHAWQHD